MPYLALALALALVPHGYHFFKDANPGAMDLVKKFLAEHLTKERSLASD